MIQSFASQYVYEYTLFKQKSIIYISMSNKNILQEYCQKNKLDMPIYASKSDGPAHQLNWYCKIKVSGMEIETVNPSNSKTNAEQLVAKLALEQIKLSTKINPDIESDTIDSIYLIDLENKPVFGKKLNPFSLYIGFHNDLHHSIPKYADWHVCSTPDISKELAESKSNKLLYLITGGVSDLVDHLMSMLVYPLATYLKSNSTIRTVNIVSGDHAGFCTKSCLEKALEWCNITHIKIKNTINI